MCAVKFEEYIKSKRVKPSTSPYSTILLKRNIYKALTILAASHNTSIFATVEYFITKGIKEQLKEDMKTKPKGLAIQCSDEDGNYNVEPGSNE